MAYLPGNCKLILIATILILSFYFLFPYQIVQKNILFRHDGKLMKKIFQNESKHKKFQNLSTASTGILFRYENALKELSKNAK